MATRGIPLADLSGAGRGAAPHPLGRAVTRATCAADRAGALDGRPSASTPARARPGLRGGATAVSTGGRPAPSSGVQPRAGVVLAADLGATHSRSRSPTSPGVARRAGARLDIARGPGRVLEFVHEPFLELLGRQRPRPRRCAASASGSRARRVRAAAGRSTRRSCPAGTASTIPGWFAARYDAPVLVDNDVNIMALGEHWARWRDGGAHAVHQGRHRDRLRDRQRRPHPPRRRGRRRRHRPHRGTGARRRRLPVRQHRLPRGGRRRPRARREARDGRARSASSREVVGWSSRATRCDAAGARRRGGRSARCWRRASTSSTRA